MPSVPDSLCFNSVGVSYFSARRAMLLRAESGEPPARARCGAAAAARGRGFYSWTIFATTRDN